MDKKLSEEELLLDKVIEFIKTMPNGERQNFACQVTFQSALWGGDNHIEMLGILECAKSDILQYVVYVDNKESDTDEWKKLIDNN